MHCSKNTVYEMIDNKEIPAYLYKGNYLIAKSDVIEYMVEHTDDKPHRNIFKITDEDDECDENGEVDEGDENDKYDENDE